MRTFKSASRPQPVAHTSSRKLQVTTEFQSDYAQPRQVSKGYAPTDQLEMKRNLQNLAAEYERLFRDRVFLAFESEGPLPVPAPQWLEDEELHQSQAAQARQERYEEDRAVQVDVQQYNATPQRYTQIDASPISQHSRSRKSSLPPSNTSTPYRQSQQDSSQVVSFLKTSTDTLAQALASLGGFTANMEQLMSSLTKTTTALHSSIRSMESQQSTHRSHLYDA